MYMYFKWTFCSLLTLSNLQNICMYFFIPRQHILVSFLIWGLFEARVLSSTVLCKTNANTCQQNLTKFLAFDFEHYWLIGSFHPLIFTSWWVFDAKSSYVFTKYCLKRPLTFNQIFSQTLDERSLGLKMQYIFCITFANTVNTVNQKQKGCLRIIRVAIDRYETFTNECNLYIFHFFFVIIVYSGAQDVCALMMKHGLTPDGKMWVYFNPSPPKSKEKVISLLIIIHVLVCDPCGHQIFTA